MDGGNESPLRADRDSRLESDKVARTDTHTICFINNLKKDGLV